MGILAAIREGQSSKGAYEQSFRLEQRCPRCGSCSKVEVQGVAPQAQGGAHKAARLDAVLSSKLARCVCCGRRRRLALPLSAALALPVAIPAGVVAAALAVPFAQGIPQALQAGAAAALLTLGSVAGMRLGRADGRVRK